MADAIKQMREVVFRAAENHNTPAARPTTTSNVLIKKTKVYALPAGPDSEENYVKAFHLFLIVCGTSLSEERSEWANYVATMVCASLPDLRSAVLAAPEYEEVILSGDALTALIEWYDLYAAACDETSTADDRKEFLDAAIEASFLPMDLPHGVLSSKVNMKDVLDGPAIYGHFSLILFLAGKTITDKNRVAISQKRPGAIEGKYYNRKNVASLTGDLSLSKIAHTYVHLSFVVLTHLRRETFTRVAVFTVNPSDTVSEIISTTTRLMRFAGMQQAVIIDDFLSGHEEAMSIPFLMPAIQAYSASMRNLAASPTEQRPFYKLIHGDTTRAFNRNDILPLLTVSLYTARELNPTLMNYEIPSNYQLVMDKYNASLAALAEEE